MSQMKGIIEFIFISAYVLIVVSLLVSLGMNLNRCHSRLITSELSTLDESACKEL